MSKPIVFDDDSKLSNNYETKFTLDGNTFSTVNQYVTWKKATLANDKKVAKDLISKTYASRYIKQLFNKIDIDENLWDKNEIKVICRSSYEKFDQNSKLKKYLIDTGDSILGDA